MRQYEGPSTTVLLFFCCDKCNADLAGKSYVSVDGYDLCDNCHVEFRKYPWNFAPLRIGARRGYGNLKKRWSDEK